MSKYAIGYQKFGKLYYLHQADVLADEKHSGFDYSLVWNTSIPCDAAQYGTHDQIKKAIEIIRKDIHPDKNSVCNDFVIVDLSKS